MTRQRRFSPEVRERAVRLVREHQGEYATQWAAIRLQPSQRLIGRFVRPKDYGSGADRGGRHPALHLRTDLPICRKTDMPFRGSTDATRRGGTADSSSVFRR